MPDYTVKSGDTLVSIARRLRTTWQNLFARNRRVIGNNPNVLKPGEKLAYGPLPTHVNLPPKTTPTPPPKVTVKKPVPQSPTVRAAIAKANATHTCEPGTCDHMCAFYYGLGSSGYKSAYINWQSVPYHYKQLGVTRPKAGLVCFWSGGSHHYGHAALSLGNGMIRCTDMDANGNYKPGVVSTIPLSDVHTRWGLEYLGATQPYFQGRLIAVV